MVFDSVYYQHTYRFVTAEAEITVDTSDNIYAEIFFGGSRLLCKCLRTPCITVLITVACHNRRKSVICVDLHHVDSVSVLPRCIIQNNGLLGNTRSNRIFFL